MHRTQTSITSFRYDWFHLVAVGIVIPLVTLAVTSCGGESTPTAPTTSTPAAQAAPTVSALRIDGPAAVRTGMSSDYTATATLSNGTTQAVTPTWSSSNSGIATVDGSGRLTGQSHGQAALTATYQGGSTTKNVAVVANFGGQWSGFYMMKACDQSGVFQQVGYCQGMGGVGAIGPVALSVTQGGTDQSQLSGTISFGGINGNLSGNVTADARMVIGASFNLISSGVAFAMTVGGWESRLSGPSSMTGRWADNLTATGVPGNVYTENELQVMTRSSLASAGSAAPPMIRLEWAELFESMRRRQR